MTDRRTFHRILGSVLCAGTIGVRAQPANRVYRVGVLRPTPAPPTFDPFSAEVVMPKTFARMEYLEGRNFHLVYRYADGDLQRLPALARDLVQQRVDVIVTVGLAVMLPDQAPGALKRTMFAMPIPAPAKFTTQRLPAGSKASAWGLASAGLLMIKSGAGFAPAPSPAAGTLRIWLPEVGMVHPRPLRSKTRS